MYSLEVDVSYVDRAGVPGVSKTVLGIPLHGIVELVTYDVEVKPAIPGGTFNLIFTLLNRGTTTAMYTTISLVSEGPFKAAGQPIYVGDLDPNAPLPVSLQIQVRPDTSPGIYQVKVQVYYKDEYHRPHKEYLTFPVKVLESLPVTETVKAEKTPREAVAGFTPIISAVVVAAAVAGAVLYFKRRKAKALQPSQG
ncbi:MAG: hypothetical protein DRO46_04740 [Candidatus Hecatellales archaeon]|nr:MAG: hypothetical protein DRO46_04740 [Candidatus Hecatellales archaeon]